MSGRLPFAARRDPCELAEPDSAALARIEGKLDALRADVGLLLARAGAADPRLSALLPLIYDAAGDSVWIAADVAALAALPGRDALAATLAPLLGHRGGLRSFGKCLARATGRDMGGYRLVQVGTDRAGALWQVKQV